MIKDIYSYKPLKKPPSILNQLLHSKTIFLCFITSKGAKEVVISGKEHVFPFTLLVLIWFCL